MLHVGHILHAISRPAGTGKQAGPTTDTYPAAALSRPASQASGHREAHAGPGGQSRPVRVEVLVTQNSFPSGSRITVHVSGLSKAAGSCRTSTSSAPASTSRATSASIEPDVTTSRRSRFLPTLGSGTFMKYSVPPGTSGVADQELIGIALADLVRQRVRHHSAWRRGSRNQQ